MKKTEAEGGCGVIGSASQKKMAARHLLPPLQQMKNRGNGKGGGIAAVGMDAEFFNTTDAILNEDYLVAIAYLDRACQREVEALLPPPDHIFTFPEKSSAPYVVVYFVHSDDATMFSLAQTINKKFYAHKQAFVLSNAKNMLVLKMVGYGDDVISSYDIYDLKAHVLIGHHRYPTRGKVWHPGGAHPFVGLHEALVHNGDFANYYSLAKFLTSKDREPLFSTDTEVAAQLFDYLVRTCGISLELTIEALAPTRERDFTLLDEKKQLLYDEIQRKYLRVSPDGPWFFLIARSLLKTHQLVGITDTSMLRPQVFAIHRGSADIGLAASEKQAIDGMLQSLSREDSSLSPIADYYWNARGGSHTDGGAFYFTVTEDKKLLCQNKFGDILYTTPNTYYRESMLKYNTLADHLYHGERFIGCGLKSQEVTLDIYGSSGDYLASGIDGATIEVYGDAQDQVAQIMNGGTLIIHGNVGQAFMYGAKGGVAFVKGNTAGRALINAVGNPRVVINGTSQDYLAESFMAGDPLNGGGFIIVNGIAFDAEGNIVDLETPYSGNNLFSLASGGAIYIRDPEHKITNNQLNGGSFFPMSKKDWELMLPYLEQNERHFDIRISRLLTYEGKELDYTQVYRKIAPIPLRPLMPEESWVKAKD